MSKKEVFISKSSLSPLILSFRSGFFSGLSSLFSVGTQGYGGFIGRTVIMAVVGGTASVLGGGKFASGAMAGAFMQMFNVEARSYIKSLNARQILQVDKFRKYVENMDLKTFNKAFNLYLTSDSEMWIYKADIYKQLNPAIIRGAYDMTEQAIKDIGGTRSLIAPIKAVYHLFGPGGEIGYDFIEGTTTLRGIYEIH